MYVKSCKNASCGGQGAEQFAVQEGLFLYERGLDPYDGGIFHQVGQNQILDAERLMLKRNSVFQAPLLLPLFSLLPTPSAWFGRILSVTLFASLDFCSADALFSIASSGAAPVSSVYRSPRKERAWQPVSVAAV